jgi:hypothetical protein
MAWGVKTIARNRGLTPANAIVKAFSFSNVRDSCPVLFDMYSPHDPDSIIQDGRSVSILAGDTAAVGVGGRVNNGKSGFLMFNGSAGLNMKEFEHDYFAGPIQYRDSFPNTPGRETKFCFAFGVRLNSAGDDMEVYNAGLCPYWNCTDEECKRDADNFKIQAKQSFEGLPKAQQHCALNPFDLLGKNRGAHRAAAII